MVAFLKLATILIFIATYIFIVFYYEKKAKAIWISIALLLLLGALSPFEALKAINLNVLGIYIGMLFISEMFIYSKVPDCLAIFLVNKAKHVSTVLLLISIFAGVLSISVENVAVVLIVAPIALAMTRKLKISPVPLLTAIAISANLQGVATLIGDPPSMIMAGFAKLTFNDFFFFHGKPSLFFVVQIGAIAGAAVLYFFFRHHKHPTHKLEAIKPKSIFPAILLVLLVVALAFSSFLDPGFRFLAGLTTLVFAMVAVLWYYTKNKEDVFPLIKRVDWETGFFLAGVFILVQSLIKVRVIDDLARIISSITGTSIIFTYIIIILASLLLSAFVDNVPYIATMLPVVQKIAVIMNVNPILFYFGLLIGASVGGNITPVGASANIVAMGIAKKEGYHTNFWDFVKIGLPFTIVATLASTAFVWMVFG